MMGNPLFVDTMNAMGGNGISMGYGEVFTALQTGVIDGAENNWPSFVTTGHYKYAGYYILTQHTVSPEVLIMSRKAWASLSPDEQVIFLDAAQRSSIYMREKWRELEERSRKQAELAGVKVVTDFDRKPFEAAMAPLYAKAEADPAMARLIARIRQVP